MLDKTGHGRKSPRGRVNKQGTGRTEVYEVASDFFGLLGLGEVSASVYSWVSREGPTTESELSRACEVNPTQILHAIDELVHAGFARVSQDDQRLVSTLRPDAGIASAIVSAESTASDQLGRLATVRRLAETFQSALTELREQRDGSSFETLEDSNTAVSRLHELNHETQHEILTCVPTRPPRAALEAARVADAKLLNRGVKVRGIYLHACWKDPATMDYLQWMQDSGAQVRLAVTLAGRIQIFDRRVAVVAESTAGDTPGAIVVHSEGLVSALLRLFEYAWDAAETPFKPSEPPSNLTAQHRQILWLLARGAKDDTVARHIGVSPRTVRRAISELSTELGTASRFELGVKCAQLGWTSGKPGATSGDEMLH